MRLINHRYDSLDKLNHFIETTVPDESSVLVQLFSGVTDKALIRMIIENLALRIPHAAVIGCTTAGEIMDGKMSSDTIVLSFSLFDTTTVTTHYYPHTDYDQGVRAAQEILSDRTKVCIALAEGLHGDSESFLNGFSSVRNDIIIAGGNAGDDLTFSNTCVINQAELHDQGMVIAVLESDRLQVHNAYSLYWTPVGKKMTVTRADKNMIYEIDGRPVKELYTHYLGAEAVSRIPASAIEFPLIKVNDDVPVARSIIGQTPEGGFVYAGHFQEGDQVRFAIGNIEDILNHAVDVQKEVASLPVEATYIYSCSVRKLFLNEQLNLEFGLINDIAPSAGFFTYGEFYHSDSHTQLLNITTTTLSLSESQTISHAESPKRDYDYRHTMLKSLTHLVNVTQHELNDNIKILDQYKMVLDQSSIVSKTDTEGFITYVNEAFCEISGYSKEELIGQKHSIVRHPDSSHELFVNLWQTISSGKIWKKTFKNLSKKGEEYYVKSVIAPIFDDQNNIIEYIAARVNVTDLIAKDAIIQRQLTDTLTGLKNRTALLEDLEKGSQETILALFNIDRFSDINGYFGYEVGDTLLKAFAVMLESTFDDVDLYRISGDEFALIYARNHCDGTFKNRIIKYLNELENHTFQIEGYDIFVNVSGSVAFANRRDVYNFAHIALNEAKERQEKVVFFNDHKALGEKTRENVLMVNKIKSAIEEDRIVPYFQGIVNNESRTITKYESLIRLVDPDGTVVSPFWFLEHAKKSKLYDKLTRIMIAKTFAVFEGNEYGFSLNMTLQDIMSVETRTFLYDRLKHSSAATRLVIEIVESEGIEHFDEVADFIRTVKGYGCKIAIDDFGTGYSNFHYLSKLDVDFIKIDGSLIKNITLDEDHLFTVESILFFARKKGIKTIAEFVEDEAIFSKLVELGVDYSQGYLFSIPSPDIHS